MTHDEKARELVGAFLQEQKDMNHGDCTAEDDCLLVSIAREALAAAEREGIEKGLAEATAMVAAAIRGGQP